MGDAVRIVVIGGGIAGVGAAWALATHPSAPSVVLVEAEERLAHHTTGRSAALLIENYGTAPTRVLTGASLPYFRDPPDGTTDHPLLSPRGVLTVAGPDQAESFAAHRDEGTAVNPSITEIPVRRAADLFPALRPELVDAALHEPDAADIDVSGLHQSFVRGARAVGAEIRVSARVTGLRADGTGWAVPTTGGPLSADLVVNAAGAWGDRVAALAGIGPLGLRPLRRTAFTVASDRDGSERWPLLMDVDHDWYVKPDGRQFLCSPADETPSEPCDARPEEIDVARAIDSINTATTLGIRSVGAAWAGLRTFTPDRTVAIGPDPDHPGFVWCVGQGGTGIQTAPAAARLVADLALDGRPGPTFPAGFDPAGVLPSRFR